MEIHDLINCSLGKLEKGYVPRIQATDANGNAVSPTNPDAKNFCLYGAIVACYYAAEESYPGPSVIEPAMETIAKALSEKEIKALGTFSENELNVWREGPPEQWGDNAKCVGFNNVMGQEKTCDLLRRALELTPA
jgi:hypothetical protein